MNARHYIYAAIVQLRAFGPAIVCEAGAVSGDHDRLGVRPDPMRGTYTARALRRGDRPRKSEIVLPAGEAATQVALDDALATWAIARLAVSPVVSEGGALGGAAVLDALVAWIGADLAPAHSAVDAPCALALIAVATHEGEGATTKATRAGRRRRGKRGGRKHHRDALDFNAALAQFVEAHGLVQDRPGHFAAAHRTAG